ncbi:hypothetical protein QR680_004197 [Steinernema hermaphroditum]|uniref:ZP domain-containing protein n=1 Tax=Steinernema hermaphroditum TaxID=289476 RepID=A0AA39LTL7_9BILA|nr:hypothetical protein QR680_004197 [Steinernema hermaphroditum]
MNDVGAGLRKLNVRQLRAEPSDIRRFGNVTVLCTDKTIGLQFSRDVHFGGRIFTSRMERNPMCVQHYSPTTTRNRFEVPLNSLECGVKSSKKTHPYGGLEYSVSIVLSYNHMYLTEDDLVYNIKCNYPSPEMAVGTMYEASLFTKSSAVGEIASPTCNYSLHIGTLDGPTPSKALIGQKVFHKWQCNTSDFTMKVYRCYVHNGQQKKYLLVDDEGCSLDPAILPELIYDKDLNYVYATSSVFRFTDTSKVFFNCLLYMCPKGEPSCQRNIPPKCHPRGGKRGRRESHSLESQLLHEEGVPFPAPIGLLLYFRRKNSFKMRVGSLFQDGFLHSIHLLLSGMKVHSATFVASAVSGIALVVCLVGVLSIYSEVHSVWQEFDAEIDSFRSATDDMWRDMVKLGKQGGRVRRQSYDSPSGGNTGYPGSGPAGGDYSNPSGNPYGGNNGGNPYGNPSGGKNAGNPYGGGNGGNPYGAGASTGYPAGPAGPAGPSGSDYSNPTGGNGPSGGNNPTVPGGKPNGPSAPGIPPQNLPPSIPPSLSGGPNGGKPGGCQCNADNKCPAGPPGPKGVPVTELDDHVMLLTIGTG